MILSSATILSTPFEPQNATSNSNPNLIEKNAKNDDFISSLIPNSTGTIEKIETSSGVIVILGKKRINNKTSIYTVNSYELKNNEKTPIVTNKEINSYTKIKTNDELLFGLRNDNIDVYNLKYQMLIKTCKTRLNDEIGNITIKASKNHIVVTSNKSIEIFDCLENENVYPINTLKCKGIFVNFAKLIEDNLFIVSTKVVKDLRKDILETWNLKNILKPTHKKNFSFNKTNRSCNFVMNENVLCRYNENILTLSNVDSGVRITPENKDKDCAFVKIDGSRLFKGKNQIEIWDIEKFKSATKSTLQQSFPKKLRELQGHKTWVHWIQVCGNLLVSGTLLGKTVKVWNVETGECFQNIESPVKNIKLAFNRIILVVPSNESSIQGQTNLQKISNSIQNRTDNILIYNYNN